MKKLLLILLLFHFALFTCLQVHAQNPNIKRTWHWRFGTYAGLDFNTGQPVAVTTGKTATQCHSLTMSDTAGNLLFYMDGSYVYNKNNVIMPNGTMPFINGGIAGTAQFVALPKSDSANIYYVFGADYDTTLFHTQMEYFIIDMTKDGGLGDVVSKGNILPYPYDCTTSINAVPIKNEHAYWIITTKLLTDTFYVYRFSDSGVSYNPIISSAGKIDSIGDASINPSYDGKKLALGFNGSGPAASGGAVELLDFNDSTGIISNPLVFPICNCEDLGLAFSPNDKLLYSTVYYLTETSDIEAGNAIYQYNLAAGSPAAIIASKTLLDSVWQIDSTDAVRGFHYGLQLASDGKIYSTRDQYHSLGVINYPDSLGTACDNIDSSLSLLTGFSDYYLSDCLSSYFYDSTLVNSVPVVQYYNAKDSVIIYPNPNNGVFTLSIANYGLRITNYIEIYNMLGKQVASLPSKGGDKIQVNLSKEPKGIYLYRVVTESGKQISTGKFILL